MKILLANRSELYNLLILCAVLVAAIQWKGIKFIDLNFEDLLRRKKEIHH